MQLFPHWDYQEKLPHKSSEPVVSQSDNTTGSNNPTNLKTKDAKSFRTFDTVEEGINASADQLYRYFAGEGPAKGKPTKTVKDVIALWRPESDRRGEKDISQANYEKIVAQSIGVKPTEKIDINNPQVLGKLIQGITKVEGKEVPLDTIMKAINNSSFNPEGSGYDYETAKAAGLDPKDIVRTKLYPGEDKYFKENPNVGGMMTEDNRVIINPYSKLSDKEKDAIRINESIRLIFKQENIVPNIEITNEQRAFFKGTPYENNEEALKQTIMARILTNDPSAKATKDQLKESNKDIFKAIQENIDHWGSVVPASEEDKVKYNLPEESYMIVKGKAHKTFNKAVEGEKARGFEVKKFGTRYYSIPKQ